MIYHTCFVASLFAIVAVNHLTYGQDYDERDIGDCGTCNDLEIARKCGMYDWCKHQAIACGAKKYFLQASKGLWKTVLEELDGFCRNEFKPFKKLYGSADLVNINLQVSPDQEPFTLSFDFKGDTRCDTSRHGISIKLNEKLVYDDFNVAKTTK